MVRSLSLATLIHSASFLDGISLITCAVVVLCSCLVRLGSVCSYELRVGLCVAVRREKHTLWSEPVRCVIISSFVAKHKLLNSDHDAEIEQRDDDDNDISENGQ